MNKLTSWLLWGDRDKFHQMGDNFRGEHAQVDTNEILIALLCLSCVVIALWLLSQYVARRERSKRLYSPWRLFKELCQAHGLDRSHRQALKRLARQQQLEHPARLFLEPERFEQAAAPQERELYLQLKTKLFA